MNDNAYHFITHWRVQSTVEEITAILSKAVDLPRWWPSVYLDIKELVPGNTSGVGAITSLYTKGWLPYTLKWQCRVTESRHPHGFTLEAWGDFVGRGIWTFDQDGTWVNIAYDWKIRADKPLLRTLSPILKPVFAANHEWAMRQGLTSLELELARRRAESSDAVPAPPGPTFAFMIPKDEAPKVLLR